MNCSLPGSSVHRVFQARILVWVSISFSNACMHAKSLQLCPTLCDPIDGSPPGSSVPGILQARILKWVAISFSIGKGIYERDMSHNHSSNKRSLKVKLDVLKKEPAQLNQ